MRNALLSYLVYILILHNGTEYYSGYSPRIRVEYESHSQRIRRVYGPYRFCLQVPEFYSWYPPRIRVEYATYPPRIRPVYGPHRFCLSVPYSGNTRRIGRVFGAYSPRMRRVFAPYRGRTPVSGRAPSWMDSGSGLRVNRAWAETGRAARRAGTAIDRGPGWACSGAVQPVGKAYSASIAVVRSAYWASIPAVGWVYSRRIRRVCSPGFRSHRLAVSAVLPSARRPSRSEYPQAVRRVFSLADTSANGPRSPFSPVRIWSSIAPRKADALPNREARRCLRPGHPGTPPRPVCSPVRWGRRPSRPPTQCRER